MWPQWRPLLPHILEVVESTRPLDNVVDEVTELLRETGIYLQVAASLGRPCPSSNGRITSIASASIPTTPTLLNAATVLALDLREAGEVAAGACAE